MRVRNRWMRILVLVPLALGCMDTMDSADELIEAHLKARGGYEAIKAVQTVTAIGTYAEPSFTQIHRFDKQRPNLIRVTTNYDTLAGTFGYCEGFDGAAWEYSFGIPVRVTGEPARALKSASGFEPSFMDYRRKGYTATFLGETSIRGIPVYHLQITMDGGDADQFFFDVSTLMESVSIGNAPFHGDGAVIEIFERRSDYRSVAGVLMPFRIEQMSGDSALSTLTWHSIKVNEPTEDDWFSPPLSRQQTIYKTFREDLLASRIDDLPSRYGQYLELANQEFDQRLENELNTLGHELISYRRYGDAIRVIQLALGHFPQSSNLHDSMGEIYLLAGDTAKAVRSYQEAVRLDPDNQWARDILARIAAEH